MHFCPGNLFIFFVFLFQLYQNECLPGVLCDNCVTRLNSAYEFKRQSEASDQHLRNFIVDVFDKVKSLTTEKVWKEEKLELLDKKPPPATAISTENKPTPSAVSRPAVKLPTKPVKLMVQLNVNKPENKENELNLCNQDNDSDYITVDVNNTIAEAHSTEFEPAMKRRCIKTTEQSTVAVPMCLDCKKGFCNKANLMRHMITHEIQNPLQCSICSTRFMESDLLKKHMYIHTNERGFQCPMCDASFTHDKTLQAHMRRHTDDMPYKCAPCGFSFRQRFGLKVNSFKGPFYNKI